MTSTKNSSETNNFEGIWNRDNKKEEISTAGEELVDKKEELGSFSAKSLKRKTWGIPSFIGTFFAFLIIQSLVLVLIAPLTGVDMTDADALTKLLTTSAPILLVSNLTMYIVWVAGMALVTFIKGQKSFKKDFRLSIKKLDVVYGLLTAIGLFALVQGLTWFLSTVFKLDMAGSDNGSVLLNFEGAWLYIIAFGMAGFLGPICEELFFRGFALSAIEKTFDNAKFRHLKYKEDKNATGYTNFLDKIKTPIAVIISSVVFGFMHFQGTETFGQWFVIIVTGLIGLVLGIIVAKTNRLGIAIFAHIFYNSGTIALAMLIS